MIHARTIRVGSSTKQFALMGNTGQELLRFSIDEISIDSTGFIGGYRGRDGDRELVSVINLDHGQCIKEVTDVDEQSPSHN